MESPLACIASHREDGFSSTLSVQPNEVAFLALEEIAHLLASRQASAVDLVEMFLSRISRFDSKLQAFARTFENQARLAAEASDKARAAGRVLSPFHGVPFAVKDVFEFAGFPTEAGSPALSGRISTETATAVRRLEAAGMIVIGKTNMVEFSYGSWGANPGTATPWNPWDLERHRVPGGSSSGTAVAVASGMVPCGLGSDTGGSCRTPAAFCGVVGMKTSRGLIGRGGVIQLAVSHDTVGYLTRSVRDAGHLLTLLAGVDPADEATINSPTISPLNQIEDGVRGFRIGRLSDSDLGYLEPDVKELIDQVLIELQVLGASIDEMRFPRPLEEYFEEGSKLIGPEVNVSISRYIDSVEKIYDPVVRQRVLNGQKVTAVDYIRQLGFRNVAQHEMAKAMETFHAFVAPTCHSGAPPANEVDEQVLTTRYGRLINYLDLASVAVPIGFTRERLPAGFQIVVRRFDDSLALRIARALEKHRGRLVTPPPGFR